MHQCAAAAVCCGCDGPPFPFACTYNGVSLVWFAFVWSTGSYTYIRGCGVKRFHGCRWDEGASLSTRITWWGWCEWLISTSSLHLNILFAIMILQWWVGDMNRTRRSEEEESDTLVGSLSTSTIWYHMRVNATASSFPHDVQRCLRTRYLLLGNWNLKFQVAVYAVARLSSYGLEYYISDTPSTILRNHFARVAVESYKTHHTVLNIAHVKHADWWCSRSSFGFKDKRVGYAASVCVADLLTNVKCMLMWGAVGESFFQNLSICC
jgi:hypothetical protein